MYGEYFVYHEDDYKLFCDRIKSWQERYLQKFNEEYYASMKKSNMFNHMFDLLKDKIIDDNDLIGFSEKLVADLKETLRLHNYNLHNV